MAREQQPVKLDELAVAAADLLRTAPLRRGSGESITLGRTNHIAHAAATLHFHDEYGERGSKACVHQQSVHRVLQSRVLNMHESNPLDALSPRR